MSLRTPIQSSSEKKIHTPPSIERDPGKPKLLKSLSGRVFKRSSNSDNDTLASTGLFVPAPSLSNRYPVPKPLNIPQPLSPPPSIKKTRQWSPGCRSHVSYAASGNGGSDALESPIQLGPSLKVQSLERPLQSFNLTAAFNSGYRSEPRTEVSPHDNTIIWTESVDDPYLEEDSPTYLRASSRNLFKVNERGGHRTFFGLQCSMCDEKICGVLSGEKIMELTCSHASHYQCYLATLECLHPSKRYPQCRICGKTVKPCDKSILEKMMTHLLLRKNSCPETVVEPQMLYSKQTGTASQHAFFTPGEQIIRTADICSSGFQTPYGPLRSAADGEWHGSAELYDALLQSSMWLEETLLGSSGQEEPLAEDNDPDTVSAGSQIEVIAQRSGSEYGITVKVPNESGRESHQEEQCDEFAGTRESFKKRIEESIVEDLDNDTELGTLVMFDKGDFSTDGERWSKNVMLYLFSRFLVLFDRQQLAIRGKISLEQICQVLKMNDSTLLIDLKSRTLPQVYISFPSKSTKNPLLEKWKFYLGQTGNAPSLREITATSWGLLPEELAEDLKSFFAQTSNNVSDSHLTLPRPWETSQAHVPLQLIVCLSLSNDSGTTNAEYHHCICQRLKCLLNLLNADDLLGLVAVGKDGKGNVGRFGTFFGTVNNRWPHWDEAFHDLAPSRPGIFDSAESELDKMLETCLRLVSTADSMLDEDKSARFAKKVILLREASQPKSDHKYGRLIAEVHGFDVMQLPAINNIDCDELTSVINTMHQSYLRDLTISYANQRLSLGNMAPGEQKSLSPLNLNHLPVPESCEVSWIDARTLERASVVRRVSIA